MNRLEVIVCVIVFLLIASMFLPSVRDARGTARRTQCLNNMRNIGMAVQNYAVDHKEEIPATRTGTPSHSWRLRLAPYLEARQAFEQYQFDLNWDEGDNQKITKFRFEVMTCPSETIEERTDEFALSAFSAITGPNTMWGKEKSLTLDEVAKADGLSQTILISEAAAEEIVWTEPRDVDLNEKKTGIEILRKPRQKSEFLMTSFHSGSVNLIFADGSGRNFSDKIEPRILKALCTATGGEVLTSADY